MQKRTVVIGGISALSLLVALTVAAASVDAQMGQGRQIPADVQAAMTAGNYDEWVKLMGDNPVTEVINKDNFAKFTQMHELLKAGKFTEAKTIADELGLKQPGRGGRFGQGQGAGKQLSTEDQAKLKTAIESGDYTTWSTLMNGRPITKVINATNFSRYGEMWKLQQQVKAIRQELGLPARGGHGMGMMPPNDNTPPTTDNSQTNQ